MLRGGRDMRRLLGRMGFEMKEVPGVEEVVIRTGDREIVVRNASVSEIAAKGLRMFQVVGEVEERVREVPKAEAPSFTEEDVLLVAQQAGVSRETAEAALRECEGDLAKAIIKLTSG